MTKISVFLALYISACLSTGCSLLARPSETFPSIVPSATPSEIEVCFSPDEACDQALVRFIDSAIKSIDIAIYDINLDQLVHHLLTARQRNITVRIVVDKRQSKGSHSLVPTLIEAGASVRYGHQRGIMHNKFSIVDGKKLETGSFNYTNHATKANQENQIYLTDSKVVSRYQVRFEKIWADAR